MTLSYESNRVLSIIKRTNSSNVVCCSIIHLVLWIKHLRICKRKLIITFYRYNNSTYDYIILNMFYSKLIQYSIEYPVPNSRFSTPRLCKLARVSPSSL